MSVHGKRKKERKKKKGVRVAIEGRAQQPVCKLTHFYICLMHNTRLPTLPNGGTVKSGDIPTTIAADADNLSRAFLYFSGVIIIIHLLRLF